MCVHGGSAADVNTLKVPDSLPDEKVIFLSDIMPTGMYLMACMHARVEAVVIPCMQDVLTSWQGLKMLL